MLGSEQTLECGKEEADSEHSSVCVSSTQRTHPSLPTGIIVWDTPLLAAEAEEKLPGAFYSSGGHRDYLTVLSPKHEVAEELPEMLEDQANTTGFEFECQSLHLHNLHLHRLQKPVPDITCRAQGCARTKIFTTSGKPADVRVLDFTDLGEVCLFAKAGYLWLLMVGMF